MRKLFFALTFLSLSFMGIGHAKALSGAEFQSGRIMDDGIFFDSGSINASTVQSFLNSKVPTCDTWHTRSSSPNDGGPPYTCLKDYRQDTPTKAADGLCNQYNGGNKSSSQIIYDVGQSCGINPKVLIVLLEKEQSLVTDTWPWWIQYRSATGYGCPDTAPCDSDYYGFFNQVYNAARQFKRYARDSSQFSYRAYRNNYIQYNPNANCGGGNVYIQNQATAGLYNYTPYQPNSAALSNLYGGGDGCSAFGNRNFWRLYNDWFGNPISAPLYSSYYSQSAWPTVSPGSQTNIYIMYQNRGVVQWFDDSSISRAPAGTKVVHLATSHAINRSSIFSASWPSPNRPAVNFSAVYEADGTTLAGDQHVVYPGQIVKFQFPIKVPAGQTAASYTEFFQPIAEGVSDGGFNDPWTSMLITVSAQPALAWHSQGVYPTIIPGDKVSSYLRYKNTGNATLFDDTSLASAPSGTLPVHLAASSPLNRTSAFSATWPTASRAAVNFSAVYEADGTTLAPNQHVAQPGQIIKFEFFFTAVAGQAAGTTSEHFSPILEGSLDGYFPDQGAYLDVTIPSTLSASYTLPTSISLTANQTASTQITVKNTGNQTMPSTTRIYSTNGSEFSTTGWTNGNDVTTLGTDLAPLGTKVITIPLLAPGAASSNNSGLNIELRQPDNTKIYLSSVRIPVSISAATYSLVYASQGAWPILTYNDTKTTYLSYKNTGNQPWFDDSSIGSATIRNPKLVHLATAQPLNRTSNFAKNWPSPSRPAVNFSAVYEADGTTLASNQHVVQPGQIAKYQFNLSPTYYAAPGIHREYFQPIVEGSSDGLLNFAWTFQDVTVSQPVLSAAYAGQSAYPTVAKGSTGTMYFNYKNQGNVNWYDDAGLSQALPGTWPIHLSTSHPLNRQSGFKHTSWPSPSRPAVNFSAVYEADGTTLASNQHVVQPGQIARFQFTINVPGSTVSGSYNEFFQPVAEGSIDGVFADTYTFQTVTVN